MDFYNPFAPLVAVFGAIFAWKVTAALFRHKFVRPWTLDKVMLALFYAAAVISIAQIIAGAVAYAA